jgi:hypothetical protein
MIFPTPTVWFASLETAVSAASAGPVRTDAQPSVGLDFVTVADKLKELTGHETDRVSRRAMKPLVLKQIEPELIDVQTHDHGSPAARLCRNRLALTFGLAQGRRRG